jgi:hypothetical protein
MTMMMKEKKKKEEEEMMMMMMKGRYREIIWHLQQIGRPAQWEEHMLITLSLLCTFGLMAQLTGQRPMHITISI